MTLQDPAAIAVTTFPETVHVDAVVELKVTAPVPDPPEVERVAVDPTRREEDIEIESPCCCIRLTA